MKGRPQFNNFSGGELDPRIHARTDLEEYHSSVKTMSNMIGQVQGPAVSRGGTRHVCVSNFSVPHSSAKFLSQLRDGYGAIGLLTRYYNNPTDQAQALYVTPAGGVSYNAYAIFDFLLEQVGHANVTVTPANLSGGIQWEPGWMQLYTDFNDGTSTTQSVRFESTAIHPSVDFWIFTVRFSEIIDDPNATVTVSVSETVAASETVLDSVTVENTNTCKILVPADITATNLYLDVSLESEERTQVTIVSINQSRGAAELDLQLVSDCPTDVKAVRSCVDISTGRGMWLHYSVIPQIHYINTTSVYNADVAFTAAPAEWAANNYPTICAFYKGRSWWSGCPSNPTQIWASRVNTAVSGDWFDMTTGALDTDSISIVRNKPGRITNIIAGSSLLVQTDVDSFVLEAQEGVLTPSDVYEVLQSGVGAATIDPINLGAVILYIANDRQSIMVTRYRFNIDAWRDVQVNSNAMHLFRGKEIRNMAYLSNEIQMVFVVFVDGTMVTGVKDPLSEVFAWSTMELALPISDIASFRKAGQDQLLLYAYGPEDSNVSSIMIYEPEYAIDCIQEYHSGTGFNSFDAFRATTTAKLFVDDLYHATNYAMRDIEDVVFAIGTSHWSVIEGTDQTEYVDFDTGEIQIRESGTWVEDYRPAYMLITFVTEDSASYALTGTPETIKSGFLASGSHIIPIDWTGLTDDIYELALTAGTDVLGGIGDCTTDWLDVLGDGWSYDRVNDEYDCSGTQTTQSYAYSTTSYCTLTVTYVVTFTVKNYSSGTVRIILGGGGYGALRSANGTYTQDITAAGVTERVLLNASIDFIGSVTDVVVLEVGTGTGLHQLAFSDDINALRKVQQFYRMKTDDDTGWGYVGAAPFNVPESFDFATANVNHVVTGCGFTQELETLHPYLPTQAGSGRSTIRGNNRVHTGLIDSAVPHIDDKTPKVDSDAEVDANDRIVKGYVRSTLTGHTRNMSVRVNQYDPEKLEVSEIILDITQSEDG